MKKPLLALALSALEPLTRPLPMPKELRITRASVGLLRQHPSLKHGKSGVAAAKRAAKKKKGRLKK